MYPALASALSRLSMTGQWGAFTAALSRAAGVSFRSLEQVLEWAKNNKGATALIASAVVEAGLSIASFLRGSDGKPAPDTANLAKEMSSFAKIGPEAAKLLAEVLGADGDRLKQSASSQAVAEGQIARCTLAYVRDVVLMSSPDGSDVTARMLELHAALQLFMNMPRGDVERLLNDRISPVPQYSRQHMRPYLLAGA